MSCIIVSPTNGMTDPVTVQGLRSPAVPGMPEPEGDGPAAARAKVREVLRNGADVIKIAVSGGVSAPRVSARRPLYTLEEIAAVVDESHQAGVPVACHAVGGPNILVAVRAGVDTIEHGAWLDDEAVAEMARRGTWYVPTFAIYRGDPAPPGPGPRADRAAPGELRARPVAHLATDRGSRRSAADGARSTAHESAV